MILQECGGGPEREETCSKMHSTITAKLIEFFLYWALFHMLYTHGLLNP
jgi:hypothetical protein